MKAILVTGGAGYVGSHAVRALARANYLPVVLDNLSEGHSQAVVEGKLHQGDLTNSSLLDELFRRYQFQGVLHFAARCYVGESMEKPLLYFQNNVAALLPLLRAMVEHQVRRLVFSSTCAVYGLPRKLPLSENHPRLPVNPYGESKWMAERILRRTASAHGLLTLSLRYFNAAGASSDGLIGESHDPETHLIPRILQTAKGSRRRLLIHGTDYPTPDGTCIRDFVHVEDLAEAHVAGLEYLGNNDTQVAFNLGCGEGWSVRQVIREAERVCGRSIPTQEGARRPGDPAQLVADISLASQELGWKPRRSSLDRILTDAWRWEQNRKY